MTSGDVAALPRVDHLGAAKTALAPAEREADELSHRRMGVRSHNLAYELRKSLSVVRVALQELSQ